MLRWGVYMANSRTRCNTASPPPAPPIGPNQLRNYEQRETDTSTSIHNAVAMATNTHVSKLLHRDQVGRLTLTEHASTGPRQQHAQTLEHALVSDHFRVKITAEARHKSSPLHFRLKFAKYIYLCVWVCALMRKISLFFINNYPFDRNCLRQNLRPDGSSMVAFNTND